MVIVGDDLLLGREVESFGLLALPPFKLVYCLLIEQVIDDMSIGTPEEILQVVPLPEEVCGFDRLSVVVVPLEDGVGRDVPHRDEMMDVRVAHADDLAKVSKAFLDVDQLEDSRAAVSL